MIVDPDFPTHYKTRALIARLGESAPMVMITLWCHCQSRKTLEFELTGAKLKAITVWQGDGDELLEILVELAFLDDLGGGRYLIHGFEERNKQIVRMWGNNKASKPKPIVNEAETTCNEAETASIKSNLVSSNLVSSEEGECEGEEPGTVSEVAEQIQKFLAEISATRDWQPNRLPVETLKEKLYANWQRWAFTEEELSGLVEFYAAHDPLESYRESLQSVCEELPQQIDRAKGWKRRKAGRNPNSNALGGDAAAIAARYAAADKRKREGATA